MSSLGDVRIPNSTQGSSYIQRGPVRRARKADFKCLWNLSTSPFACGW